MSNASGPGGSSAADGAVGADGEPAVAPVEEAPISPSSGSHCTSGRALKRHPSARV